LRPKFPPKRTKAERIEFVCGGAIIHKIKAPTLFGKRFPDVLEPDILRVLTTAQKSTRILLTTTKTFHWVGNKY
jgi:hypothetical protein